MIFYKLYIHQGFAIIFIINLTISIPYLERGNFEVKKSRKVSIYGNFSWCLILVVFSSLFHLECRAETPETTLVMEKALDDLISLDPAEAFEFSSTEILANAYDRLFIANPENPSDPRPGVVYEWTRRERSGEKGGVPQVAR